MYDRDEHPHEPDQQVIVNISTFLASLLYLFDFRQEIKFDPVRFPDLYFIVESLELFFVDKNDFSM